MPFIRLARWGFFSQPGLQDLGSILHCNALYTFCCGLFQIAFGAMIVSQGNASVNTLLPLAVSGFSFILSFANILLDFAAILAELDEENELLRNIETTFAS